MVLHYLIYILFAEFCPYLRQSFYICYFMTTTTLLWEGGHILSISIVEHENIEQVDLSLFLLLV